MGTTEEAVDKLPVSKQADGAEGVDLPDVGATNNSLGSMSLNDLRSVLPGSGRDQDPSLLISSDGSDLEIAGLTGDATTRGARTEKKIELKSPADVKDVDPIVVIGRPKNFDPNKPTVVVLDDFAKTNVVEFTQEKGESKGPTHGEVTARGAEQSGFNVFRVQMNSGDQLAMLQSLEQKIKSGELPVGRGDAITMSFGGNADFTFGLASSWLGTEITPQNLAQKKDEILAHLKKVSEDPAQPESLRDAAKYALGMNETIKRIQDSTGADVLHASGNDGPDRFSIQFMTANIQLRSSDEATGAVDKFSANHSLTNAAGDGVFAVKFNPKTNQFEATNPALLKPITFALREIASGKPIDRFLNDRSQVEFKIKPDEHGATTVELNAPSARPGDPRNVVSMFAGTSFANISFLQRYRPAMLAKKHGEPDR